MAKVCKLITGFDPYPHQRYTWDVGLEVREDGSGWEHPEILKTIQRQSGKSFEQAPITAHRAAMKPDSQVWITAQNGDKAVSRWSAASRTITRAMSDVRMLVSISHERTIWPNGSAFRPFAPKVEGTLDGETPDLLHLDELWAHGLDVRAPLEASILPALFMNPWGQISKTSTAGTERSEWLNADRARGREVVESGRRSKLAHFEWGVPEGVGDTATVDLDDEALVRLILEYHPLAGLHPRITFEDLAAELADTSRASFIRGLGNLTIETRAEGIVDVEVWGRGKSTATIPTDVRVGIGVDTDLLGRETTIYAGWRDPATGIGVVEIIERGAGLGWVARRVASISQRWPVGAVAIDYTTPTRAVGDACAQLGAPVVKLYGPDMGAAGTRFFDDLDAQRQTHDELRDGAIGDAMRAAVKRQTKTGPYVEAKGSAPVTAFRAALLAMWAADHMTEAEPEPVPFKIW